MNTPVTDLYYALPLDLELVIKRKQHGRCGLRESIAQHVYLILTTSFRESRFDENYGCGIWEQDFEPMTTIKWKDTIVASITESLQTFEHRLSNPSVRVEVDELEIVNQENRRIKRRLAITVKGIMSKTNEPFSFLEYLYLSPLSLD
jgi:phage baseplate assembly protein W